MCGILSNKYIQLTQNGQITLTNLKLPLISIKSKRVNTLFFN